MPLLCRWLVTPIRSRAAQLPQSMKQERNRMKKIALSGAGGQLGSVVRAALIARGNSLRSAAGSKALTPLVEGEDVMHGDLRDPAIVDRLLEGVDVLIHFAGTSVERPLPEIIENNLRGLVEVYEGARRQGVKRIVFASSNHAIGMYPVTEHLSLDCELRPDGFYGLSKVWGEALARMYWDKHGIESVCVRIGSCLARPAAQRVWAISRSRTRKTTPRKFSRSRTRSTRWASASRAAVLSVSIIRARTAVRTARRQTPRSRSDSGRHYEETQQ